MIACLSPNGQHVHSGSEPATRVFVATLHGISMLEREPGGMWSDRGLVLDGMHCGSLAIDPAGGGVFAGMHAGGGVSFSADGGLTWEDRSNGLTVEHVFSVACAARPDGTAVYAGTLPVGLFRSTDEGRHWDELPAIAGVPGRDKWSFPGPPHLPHTKSLSVDPHDPNVLFAAVEQGALLKTTDGGETWRELDGYSRPEDKYFRDVHLLTFVPSRPGELFLTTGIGLYTSPDSGESWERLTQADFRIGYPAHLIVSPLDDRVLYMSGASNDPTTWRTSHHAAGTIMRSADRGRTWEAADAGLEQDARANIEAMSIAAYPGGFTLFAGNTDGEIFSSEDGAAHWERIATGLAPLSKLGHYRNLQPATA